MTAQTFGAPRVAHVIGCPDAPADAVTASTATVLADDRLTRPHECVPPFNAPPQVLLAAADDPAHPYEPSCIWPAGEARPRCLRCRGTHPGERHWLYPADPIGAS